jgi:hypothetical protein
VRETGSGKSEGATSPAPLSRTSGAQETKPKERSISSNTAQAAPPPPPLPTLQTAPPARAGARPDAARPDVARPGTAKAEEDLAVRVPRLNGPLPSPAAAKPQRDLSRETESLMQKLNGAARELVEAIDGVLPAELERRYSSGEGHVYTHRLFEERGPMMRRSIRKRYEEEKVLRGRVDGYVRLFERLLDTVSESAQGAQLADACLASESGKLYVMLANASGRIRSE